MFATIVEVAFYGSVAQAATNHPCSHISGIGALTQCMAILLLKHRMHSRYHRGVAIKSYSTHAELC